MAPPRPAPQVLVITPAPRGSQTGNRTTALRWAGLLRQLGARVRLRTGWDGRPTDLVLAVHAQKSAAAVLAAAAARPGLPIAVLLAGTDVYPAFAPDPDTERAVARADLLLALQPLAAAALPAALRPKVRTIVQSATALPAARPTDRLRFAVLAHLRAVKDPLLPLAALAAVPASAACELHFAGGVLDAALGARFAAALRAEPRARWLGPLRRRAARQLLASSHACVVPSLAEGGANVVSEAIAAGTPVLASAVPGNLGLLGTAWPGQFPAGDGAALGALLRRFATEADYREQLVAATRALQPLVAPARERQALAALLRDLGGAG